MNRPPSRWTPEAIETALAVLAKYTKADLRAAVAEISRVHGFPCTRASLDNALRSAKKKSPTTYMKPVGFASPCIPTLPPSAPAIHDAKIYLVASDIHAPAQDDLALSAVYNLIRDEHPHGIVLNGDTADFEEISRFVAGSSAKQEGKRLTTSFNALNGLLDSFQAAAGSHLEEFHWIDGNHEARLRAFLQRGDNSVLQDDDALSLSGRLHFKTRRITSHGESPDAKIRLGNLLVVHDGLANGARSAARYYAARSLDKYRCNLMIAHSHRRQIHAEPAEGGAHTCWVLGHLCDKTLPVFDYRAKPDAWTQGCALVRVKRSGSFSVLPLDIDEEHHIFLGK